MKIMGIRIGKKRKRDVYKVEMDRLLAARLQLDPVKDADLYNQINLKIDALQKQKTTNIQNSRKMTPEGRRTLGTIIGGVALMGANFFMESHSGMLTGRRAKDGDNIMGTIMRTVTNIMSRGN